MYYIFGQSINQNHGIGGDEMNEALKVTAGIVVSAMVFIFGGVVIGPILFENVTQIQGIEAVALKMFLVKHCDQEKIKTLRTYDCPVTVTPVLHFEDGSVKSITWVSADEK